METWTIIGYLVLALLLLVPVGYVIAWGVSISRRPKLPPLPPLETEQWTHKGQQLTITYRKGARPDQKVLDDITGSIERYQGMIVEYVRETEEYNEEFKAGLSFTGISFPVDDDEQGEYDFSVDYEAQDGSDIFFSATIKDGKVKSLSAGD